MSKRHNFLLSTMGIACLSATSLACMAAPSDDPGTNVSGTNVKAVGQQTGIDAEATAGRDTNGSVNVRTRVVGVGVSGSQSSTERTRVAAGLAAIAQANVSGSNVSANGQQANVKARNADVDAGVARIGKGAQ